MTFIEFNKKIPWKNLYNFFHGINIGTKRAFEMIFIEFNKKNFIKIRWIFFDINIEIIFIDFFYINIYKNLLNFFLY